MASWRADDSIRIDDRRKKAPVTKRDSPAPVKKTVPQPKKAGASRSRSDDKHVSLEQTNDTLLTSALGKRLFQPRDLLAEVGTGNDVESSVTVIKRSGIKQIPVRAKPVIPAGRVSRISRLLALAYHCFRLVQTETIINPSELAYFGQISTTRMTQFRWISRPGHRRLWEPLLTFHGSRSCVLLGEEPHVPASVYISRTHSAYLRWTHARCHLDAYHALRIGDSSLAVAPTTSIATGRTGSVSCASVWPIRSGSTDFNRVHTDSVTNS